MIEFIEWLKLSDENFWLTAAVAFGATWSLCAIGNSWRRRGS